MLSRDQIPSYTQALAALKNGDDATVESALLRFDIRDHDFVQAVTQAVRVQLTRPGLTPLQIVTIGRALLGLERLPLRTPGLDINITLAFRGEDWVESYDLYVSEDRFITDTGGHANFGYGTDSIGSMAFEVEPGYRNEDGGFSEAVWLSVFQNVDGAELKVEDCSEGEGLDYRPCDPEPFWEWLGDKYG